MTKKTNFQKIIAMPNVGIAVKENIYYLAKSDIDFFKELSEFYKLEIAGIIVEMDDPFHSTALTLPTNILSEIKTQSSKTKTKVYIDVFKRFLNIVNRRTFFYLYFPFSPLLVILPLIILFRSPYALYLRGDWQRKGIFFSRINKYFLKKAKFILCTGPFLLKQVKYINTKAEMVVPMTGLINRDFVKKENYILKSIPRLLYVGRITYEKGIMELIDALNLLKMKDIEYEMHFVGPLDIQMQSNFETKIREYNLEKRIVLHGQVTDVEQLSIHYKQSDMFVFPSHHEGFPRVIYEAMAHSLPIISTKLSCIEACLHKGDEILMVPINDFEKLAESLMSLLNDEPLRKHLGTTGNDIYRNMMAQYKGTSHAQQVRKFIEI